MPTVRCALKTLKVWVQCAFVFLAVGVIVLVPSVLAQDAARRPSQKQRLPKPRVLDQGIRLERDPATGEALVRGADSAATSPEPPSVIRSRVTLVQVGCTVTAPDGTPVHGLTQDNFRVFENGSAQTIAAFDAATTPASIAIVLDASPSIYRELSGMREAAKSLGSALAPDDEVAVLAFAAETHLLLPFSRNRELLEAALDSQELRRVANSSESFIYQSVYLTAHELFKNRQGRKAIVLVTDGQDSGLGLTWEPSSMRASQTRGPLAFEDVARQLAAEAIELYVISTENRPRAMTAQWLAAHRDAVLVTPEARRLGMPHYTLYLAEMVREVGGQLYFLRELGGLAGIYQRIALTLRTEYTIEYYPAAGATPGWHSLQVELRSEMATPNPGGQAPPGPPPPAAPRVGVVPPGSVVTYRTAYYVSAADR